MILDYLTDVLSSQKYLLEGQLEDKCREILNTKNDISNLMDQVFPSQSLEEKYKILYLLGKSNLREVEERVQTVWSGPGVAGLPGRDTEILLEELILEARYSILISIYSLSSHASTVLSLLKEKAQKGVFVEIYVNQYMEKKELLNEMVTSSINRLSIYDYAGATNSKQALHAKVLTIDGEKSLITSSNLSYNGMEGNLELGVVVHSKERAKEIRAIFSAMLDNSYFKKIF